MRVYIEVRNVDCAQPYDIVKGVVGFGMMLPRLMPCSAAPPHWAPDPREEGWSYNNNNRGKVDYLIVLGNIDPKHSSRSQTYL